MAGRAWSIELSGMDRVFSKMAAHNLYQPQVKKGLGQIGNIAVNAARNVAPRGETYDLVGKIRAKVNPGPIPRWVVIKTDAVATPKNPGARGRQKGSSRTTKYPYSYPRRLEFDPKSRHKRWLKKAVDSARPRMQAAMDQVKAEIQRDWGGTP